MKQLIESLAIGEKITVDVHRARAGGGWHSPSQMDAQDLVTNVGRIYLAQRIASGDTVASAMAYMAIGSGSTAAALGDTTMVAEVDRKALAVNSATTNNVYTAIATWGGAADTVTSAVIVEAGVLNHASSGQGTLFQRVTFSSVTLADSDLLSITLQTNVGSNTI